MSRIGVEAVAGKSSKQLYEAAIAARKNLGIPVDGRLICNMEQLLEKQLRLAYGVELDPRSDNDPELQGALAAYNYSARVLKVRESVIYKLRIEDPDSLFTISHEIGHIHLHSNPDLFRREQPQLLPKAVCDPEKQADRFAREFMVDRRLLIEKYQNPNWAANYFKIPINEIKILMSQLRQEGVAGNSAASRLDVYLDQQTDFDF